MKWILLASADLFDMTIVLVVISVALKMFENDQYGCFTEV